MLRSGFGLSFAQMVWLLNLWFLQGAWPFGLVEAAWLLGMGRVFSVWQLRLHWIIIFGTKTDTYLGMYWGARVQTCATEEGRLTHRYLDANL